MHLFQQNGRCDDKNRSGSCNPEQNKKSIYLPLTENSSLFGVMLVETYWSPSSRTDMELWAGDTVDWRNVKRVKKNERAVGIMMRTKELA
jgi:hypothetical protein